MRFDRAVRPRRGPRRSPAGRAHTRTRIERDRGERSASRPEESPRATGRRADGMLAGAHAERTGELSFIDELWPALTAAMAWIGYRQH